MATKQPLIETNTNADGASVLIGIRKLESLVESLSKKLNLQQVQLQDLQNNVSSFFKALIFFRVNVLVRMYWNKSMPLTILIQRIANLGIQFQLMCQLVNFRKQKTLFYP